MLCYELNHMPYTSARAVWQNNLRRAGNFYIHLDQNFIQFAAMKKLSKLMNIWQNIEKIQHHLY